MSSLLEVIQRPVDGRWYLSPPTPSTEVASLGFLCTSSYSPVLLSWSPFVYAFLFFSNESCQKFTNWFNLFQKPTFGFLEIFPPTPNSHFYIYLSFGSNLTFLISQVECLIHWFLAFLVFYHRYLRLCILFALRTILADSVNFHMLFFYSCSVHNFHPCLLWSMRSLKRLLKLFNQMGFSYCLNRVLS